MMEKEIRDRVRIAASQMPFRDRVKRISLFGSHARGTAGGASDVDLLIEFASPIGYLGFMSINRYLENQLGLPVDLATPDSLSTYIRADILSHAETLYEQR